MRLLLDTHVLLWSFENSPRLSRRARTALLTPGAEALFSPVSVFELAYKTEIGKLPALPAPVRELAVAQGFRELPLTAGQAQLAAVLPLAHKDPWDRLLTAQALIEGLTLLTCDPAIAGLGAQVLW